MIAHVALLLFGVAAALGAPTATVLVPHVATQYHAQDELGQYVYGYSGGPSAKHEEKSLNGVTRGEYSYVDGNGLVQSAAYVSDPVNGFRVAATNLPVGPAVPANPEVAVVVPSAVAVPLVPSVAVAAVPSVSAAPVPSVSAAAVPSVSAAPVPSFSSAAVPSAAAAAVSAADAPAAPSSAVASSLVETENQDKTLAEELPEVSEEVPEKSEEPVESGDSEASEGAGVEVQKPVEDLPEVTAAREAHLAEVEEVKARNAAQNLVDAQKLAVLSNVPPGQVSAAGPVPVLATAGVPVYGTVVAPVVRAVVGPLVSKAVVAAAVAPVVAKSVVAAAVAPVVSIAGAVPLHVASQYHAQDELGQYVYGYSGGPSAKHEEKSFDGVTKGGYSYVDAHGLVQSTAYVSDPVGGFRVAATNLPQQPAPSYIPDSPEVEEAKQKLFKAQAEHVAKLAQSE